MGPHAEGHGALALFDGAKQSGQADSRRARTTASIHNHRFSVK